MTWEQMLLGLLVALLTLAGVIYTALSGRRSSQGKDQVEFIGKLIERVKTLEDGQRELWRLREEDAKVKRAQGDHIDLLEDHIWKQKPPPPPPRPAGV